MKLINRVIYMNEIKELAGTPDIKVITGVRRCGKSKLMDAFAEYLKTSDESANIIHINFNLTEFEDLLEYHALESYVEGNYDPSSLRETMIHPQKIICWSMRYRCVHPLRKRSTAFTQRKNTISM